VPSSFRLRRCVGVSDSCPPEEFNFALWSKSAMRLTRIVLKVGRWHVCGSIMRIPESRRLQMRPTISRSVFRTLRHSGLETQIGLLAKTPSGIFLFYYWSFSPPPCDISVDDAAIRQLLSLIVLFNQREIGVSEDWKKIIRQQGPSVYRIARRILGNADDADEVVQDVFLQSHQYESQNDVSNGAGLLKRLAVCRSLDRLRRRRVHTCLNDVAIVDCQQNPSDIAIGNELESRLRDAIGKLPPREAEVFCLRPTELR